MDTRCIDKDDLTIVIIQDPQDGVPGRLRLTGGDGDLFAQQRIDQCRFAGVRSADDCDESRFHYPISSAVNCSGSSSAIVLSIVSLPLERMIGVS